MPPPPENTKRAHGRYYTAANLFDTPHFHAWARAAGLPHTPLTEPFAGRGDLLTHLRALDLCHRAHAYDIAPAAPTITKRDTLTNFPSAQVIVTNPPWLARNSATRRGLPYPPTHYDDLYKHCLALCLQNAAYVAAIIPASFLSAHLFRPRLLAVDVAAAPVFTDTENPTCLALFTPAAGADIALYHGGAPLGTLSELQRHLPRPARPFPLRFNDPDGALGLIAIDNTRTASIRFCAGEELQNHAITPTSRMITRISGEFGPHLKKTIHHLNESLNAHRRHTHDIFLTPFKGLRKDGQYRRRLDFTLTRHLIATHPQATLK